MGLSPLQNPDDRIIVVGEQAAEPSRTYVFDFNTGELGGIVDGEAAVRQFIRKALVTARYRYLIYDGDYGSELDDLLGQDVTQEYLDSEIPRLIREALIYDDRIADVYDFSISKDPGDVEVYVVFSVDLTDGSTIRQGVTL